MYYLFLLGKFLALVLPRPIAYKLAEFFSFLRYCQARKERRAVHYNLTPLVEDPREIKGCARRVFMNFSYYLVDFFRYSRIDNNFIKKYVRVSGLEHVERAINERTPLIAITAHLGNYELAGAVTSLLGYPVAAVALPHLDARTNVFFNTQRQRVGISVIPTGHALRGCMTALKENKVLALLGDRDFSRHGFRLPMLGSYAYIPRGAAFFAKRTNAKIIPGFLVRERKYYYHLRFEEPLLIEKDIQEEDIARLFIPVLERYIKQYPDQWYIFEKYWIDKPGEND